MSEESIGRRMGRATLIMVFSVLLSRVMGFVREMVIAAQAGASRETDVYFAAFTLPDFLNHLLAGGALSITFIPLFSRHLVNGDEKAGWRFSSTVLTNMTVLAIPLVIGLMLFADHLVPVIAPGFDESKRAACAYLVRIILPAQYFFYVGGILMAVQYSHERFLIPALAPILYNLGIILGGVFLGPQLGMEGFSWGVLGGAFVGNFVVQLWGARRVGMRFSFRFSLRDREFLEFFLLSLPLILGFSLVLVDEWIGKALGSYLVYGSISWLNYARTLMRVPIAIVGQAAGVASYPFLARLVAEGKRRDMELVLGRALRNVLTYIVPAAALLAVLGTEVAMVLFGRGRFTSADAHAVGRVLFWFSLGIFAWGSQAILARGFYALRDTLTPTILGTICTLGAAPLAWALMGPMQVEGLALASTVGIVSYALILYGFLHRKLGADRAVGETRRNLVHFAKVAVAGIAAAGAVYGLLQLIGDTLPWQSTLGSLGRGALGGALGLVVYFAITLLLRVEGAGTIVRRLGRRLGLLRRSA